MNDKEFIDNVHVNIHALRLNPKHKPSEFEMKISKLVLEKFKDSCLECKEVYERNKNLPQKKDILDVIGGMLQRK